MNLLNEIARVARSLRRGNRMMPRSWAERQSTTTDIHHSGKNSPRPYENRSEHQKGEEHGTAE